MTGETALSRLSSLLFLPPPPSNIICIPSVLYLRTGPPRLSLGSPLWKTEKAAEQKSARIILCLILAWSVEILQKVTGRL